MMTENSVHKLTNFNPTGFEVKVSAPGKVILHGEHAVVYGRLALAASLGLRTNVSLTEIDSPNVIIVKCPSINFTQTFDLEKVNNLLFGTPLPVTHPQNEFCWEYPDWIHHDSLVDRIDNFLKECTNQSSLISAQLGALKVFFFLLTGILGSVNVELQSFVVNVETELKVGAGLGSSASYAVALSALLIQYVKSKQISSNFSKPDYKPSFWMIDQQFNPKELDMICNWAFSAEKIIHGTPSGVDNSICTYGSMVEFRKGLSPKILPLSHPFKVLLINTNIPRETKQLVQKVAKLHEKYPDLVNNVLNAIEHIAFSALQTIGSLSLALSAIPPILDKEPMMKYYEELGTLTSMNHSLLSTLGVSHLKLEEVIFIVSKHGLHGKLTGAGGGGYATALIPPHTEVVTVQNVVAELESKGFRVSITTLGGKGVTVD